MNKSIKKIVPPFIWAKIRERRIVSSHSRVARICENLILESCTDGGLEVSNPLKEIGTDKVIWQYWAQGYDNLPGVVSDCIKSVDQNKGEYVVIRLDDSNVGEYVSVPERVADRCRRCGLAQYSDLLRLALLSAYGGVWIDATVKLTGPLPEQYFDGDFFLYQRDPDEPDKDYWKNVYAYYFGWAKGYRVNMLSSFFYSAKHSKVVSELYSLYVKYWSDNDSMPDYFFLQILFDVLIKGKMKAYNCIVVSDCLPHLLQQYRNDPSFNLCSEDEIYRKTTVHKLTYKSE